MSLIKPMTAIPGAGVAGALTAPPITELSFIVEILGRNIGRFAECSGLEAEYDVFEYEEGGTNDYVHRLRGRIRYPPLVLSRGVTYEDALVDWFFSFEMSFMRPVVTITLLGSGGVPERNFRFASAFPIRWTGPTLSSGGSGAATETLEIGHTGLI
jgi:phage tail-like protein